MKRLIGCALLCVALAVPGCGEPAKEQKSESVAVPAPTWQYSMNRDQMRGTRSWAVTLQSLNEPTLKFPYEGGSPVYIRLSEIEGEGGEYAPEVVLENGQFDCSQYGGSNSCLITIKSDDHKPYDVRGVQVDCGSAKCMRLFDEAAMTGDHNAGIYKNIVDMLRATSRLTIELPLYDYGSYQYQFDTRNLHWSHES